MLIKSDHVRRVHEQALSTDSSYSAAGVGLTALGGLLFLGAGVATHLRRPESRVGLFMVLVGVGFFAEDLQLSVTPWVHSVGLLFIQISSAFLVHLVLAFPSGRLTTRIERALVTLGYATASVRGLATALLTDTSRGGTRTPNRLLINGDTGWQDMVNGAADLATVVVAIGVLAVLLVRWWRAGRPTRRVLAPVFWAGLLGSVSTVGAGLTDVTTSVGEVVSWFPRVAFCLLPLGFLLGMWRVQRGRSPVTVLLARLREPLSASQLQAALAQAVGDPSLRLGYWREDAATFVDSDGRPLAVPGMGEDRPPGALPVPAGEGVTLVERAGRPIAVLLHDPGVREDVHVLAAATTAVELALDNQRLTAEVRAQLAEVRDLAGRLVAAGDAERRRLERDLHDGAQQHLVTVALALRAARETIGDQADPAALSLLARGEEGLAVAIAELRELAHGIHPAVLTDAGLVEALRALADRTVGVRVTVDGWPRRTGPEETAAYFVAAEAVTNALKHAGAGQVRIAVRGREDEVEIEVADDGVGGADPRRGSGLVGIRDRLTALGGTLTVDSPPGSGTRVVGLIPYAGPPAGTA